jgi:2'-5' RNA ligase
VPEVNEQYLFASVRVPNKVCEALSTIQRELAQQLKEQDQRHKLVPRKLFVVPMFDFKKVPLISDEAIVLAFERERSSVKAITFHAFKIQAWPSAENMEQIVAVVEDEGGQLGALRQAVARRAESLGFTVSKDDWQPIIPLIRLSPEQEPCELIVERTLDPALSWTVDAVDVMGRHIEDQRARFQLRSTVRLPRSDGLDPSNEADEEQMRDDIAQQLQGRIEQRRVRLSETRRTERSRNLRVEDESEGPQPLS